MRKTLSLISLIGAGLLLSCSKQKDNKIENYRGEPIYIEGRVTHERYNEGKYSFTIITLEKEVITFHNTNSPEHLDHKIDIGDRLKVLIEPPSYDSDEYWIKKENVDIISKNQSRLIR